MLGKHLFITQWIFLNKMIDFSIILNGILTLIGIAILVGIIYGIFAFFAYYTSKLMGYASDEISLGKILKKKYPDLYIVFPKVGFLRFFVIDPIRKRNWFYTILSIVLFESVSSKRFDSRFKQMYPYEMIKRTNDKEAIKFLEDMKNELRAFTKIFSIMLYGILIFFVIIFSLEFIINQMVNMN